MDIGETNKTKQKTHQHGGCCLEPKYSMQKSHQSQSLFTIGLVGQIIL